MFIKLITHAKTFAFEHAPQNHPGNRFLLVSSGGKHPWNHRGCNEKSPKFASEELGAIVHISGQTN